MGWLATSPPPPPSRVRLTSYQKTKNGFQFGGSFYSQNVDEFCDTAPLITRTITDPTEFYSALLLWYITNVLTNVYL